VSEGVIKTYGELMCGRYGRRGDKQKIAETFHVKAETADFAEDEDARLLLWELFGVKIWEISGVRSNSVRARC
jgi:hypothetical protein